MQGPYGPIQRFVVLRRRDLTWPYLLQETTAWTLGQIFEFVHGNEADNSPPIISKDMLPGMLNVLAESLKDDPRVAYYICDAVRQLALGFAQPDGEEQACPSGYPPLEQMLASPNAPACLPAASRCRPQPQRRRHEPPPPHLHPDYGLLPFSLPL